MIGLDYLVAGYFHLASGNIQCQLKTSPRIDISASDTSVRYDHSKYQEQLDRLGSDTKSPYGEGVRTHVGGLMSGEVSVSQNIRIMQETYPTLNTGCLYIDSIKVNIHIKPTIYIAREFSKEGCMYKAVMEHEKKHIAVDRRIVNKYTNLIVHGLDAALKKMGYAQGPYSAGRLPVEQKRIQDYTQSIVSAYAEQMTAERKKLQQDVDSLEEYQRVNNLCRGKK